MTKAQPTGLDGTRVEVCSDLVRAAGALRAGRCVVVMVSGDAGQETAARLAELGMSATAAARVAVFVGDPDDPIDQAAATAMAVELFGRRPGSGAEGGSPAN